MCCQHFRVSFYHGEIESEGIGTVPGELTTKISPHLACMKGTEKGNAPCVALRFTEQEGYRCSIYEKRSSSCREFNILNEDGTSNKKCQELQELAKQRKRQGIIAQIKQEDPIYLQAPCADKQKRYLGEVTTACNHLGPD